MPHNRYFILFLLFVSYAKTAFGTELMVYTGSMNHTSLSGCCQSSGSKLGSGLMVRLNLNSIGSTELSAYSNGSFSSAQIAKVYYLYGQANRFNEQTPQISDPQISTKYVADWKWIFSPGVGYFSHTTRTKSFDLPALVSGVSFEFTNHFIYSINRSWSFSLSPRVIYSYSRADQGLWLGAHLGLGYEF